MKISNQDGAVSGLAVSLGLTVFLLMLAIGFSGWAFSSRQDYKSNADQKIADAVVVAKQQEGSAKDRQFLQDEKKPLKTYKGPEAYGSLSIQYPKTWSGYVNDSAKSDENKVLDGYFAPGVVPSIVDSEESTSVFALRIQVLNMPYDQSAKAIADQNQGLDVGVVAPVISVYALPKLKKNIGMKIVGTLPNGKQGEMIVLPLRSQTVEIWEETAPFLADFETNILPNFTFQP